MTLTATIARINELQGLLAPPQVAATAGAAAPPAFAGALQQAASPSATLMSATALPATGGTNAGRAALAAAEGEVGQAEQPPGSNDSPRIAQYRQATAGSGVGP